MRYLLIPILALVTACSTPSEVPQRKAPAQVAALPAMKIFAPVKGQPVRRPNAQIAQDFLDLSFNLESGRPLPILTRFEGPITIGVAPGAPASLERDLALLIARLRNEAKIDISRAKRPETAQIYIEAVPRRKLQRAVPQAACFVVPNVRGWDNFRRARSNGTTDWTKLKRRSLATVIIPNDVSPQEVRDCLHEEVAQALGPLNDLYRLPDSTFNDDNFHTVLTGFDMLVLRAYYSPQIRNGMTKSQVANVLPGLLSRLNPRGRSATGRPFGATPKVWQNAITGALGRKVSPARRASLAAQAVKIARAQGWRDNRLAFSLFVQGRVALSTNPKTSVNAFLQASKLYRELYGNSVQSAHVATQMAAFALSSGQPGSAIKIVDEATPAAKQSQNAAVLSTLLLIKAEALDLADQAAQADAVRRDALAWGRYGFGSKQNVQRRLSDIRALTPRRI